jgi:transposase InsO family protein
VRRDILRLKALMPAAGCRRIADTFNRLHADRRSMRVGKTFVADTLRGQGEEILRLRRELKHRQPRALAPNVVWALDWTWVSGEAGQSVPALGVIDHGSRACLELEPVESRTTVSLLRKLLELFERFGTPRLLRTDNEPAVRSWLFRVVLGLLGVRHQRTDPFAPWQNGRIERLFLTVKQVLRQRAANTSTAGVTASDLALVRAWYNHLRPHQHLDGRTPAEAWSGSDRPGGGTPRWFSAWDGLLAGCYWHR